MMGEERKNLMPLYADHHRPTSETPLNAFFWRAGDGPTLNAGFFQGIGTGIAKKPFFAIFQGGGGPDPCLLLWIRACL